MLTVSPKPRPYNDIQLKVYIGITFLHPLKNPSSTLFLLKHMGRSFFRQANRLDETITVVFTVK